MKIIIIGSIAAGVSAAARLAAAQRGAQITVYEKGGSYSCDTGGLPHYLCEDLDSLNKAIQAKETELNAQGITAHLRHEVRGIDAAARKVTVCDLAPDACLKTTTTSWCWPPVLPTVCRRCPAVTAWACRPSRPWKI